MAKRNRKDERKRRLLFLIFLFVLTIAIGGTATYAWFTSNRTISVDPLDVNVTTVNGLQISADAINWGAKVTRSDLEGAKDGEYGGATNQLPGTLGAMSTSGNVNGGMLDMFYGVVNTAEDGSGNYLLTATKQTEEINCTGDTQCAGKYFIAFDLFIKADADMEIVMTSNSNVVTTNIPGVATGDRGIQNAARVAFLEEGHYSADTPIATIQGAKNATTAEIWEPNYNMHTIQGAQNAYSVYGRTVATDGTAGRLNYVGVKSNVTGVNIKQTETDTTHFESVAIKYQTIAGNTDDINFRVNESGSTKLLKGVTKFRVYWWVEGQDVDAENNATGTAMRLNLEFAIKE